MPPWGIVGAPTPGFGSGFARDYALIGVDVPPLIPTWRCDEHQSYCGRMGNAARNSRPISDAHAPLAGPASRTAVMLYLTANALHILSATPGG